MTKARQSAIVIGAGIVGVSSALHLQRQGFQVTMVDRLAPGQGTSFGNAGVLGPSSVVPVPTPGIIKKIPKLLFDPSGPLFLRWSYLPKFIPWGLSFLASSRPQKVAHISQNLAALLGDCVEQNQELSRGTKAERWVQPCGYLFLFTDRQAFESDAYIWDLRREHGARWDTLEGDQLGDLVPGLGPKYRFAVLVKDHGMITNPGAYVNDLAEHATTGFVSARPMARLPPTLWWWRPAPGPTGWPSSSASRSPWKPSAATTWNSRIPAWSPRSRSWWPTASSW
jgi:D-amino-acid dehydrogenase